MGAGVIDSLSNITSHADICMLAVADSVIAGIASQLKLKKKVLVHTAGSVSMHVLKNASPNYGVLYPLQSLRKEMKTIPPIPFLVDGNSDEVKVLLYDFALHLSGHAQIAGDEQRLQMHLSAVMVSNFTNHLYALAEDYCNRRQLSFAMLQPLIAEVAGRLAEGNAKQMQTGPARRADTATIQKHLDLLKDNPALHELYQIFSDSIQKMYA
jgi:predicted short-subunit dehydrogenase-like oxidoreductase (DUF2520 family)